MSAMMHEAAAAAQMVTPASDQNLVMLHHHLCEALSLSEELGFRMMATDLCQLLRMLEH